MLENKDENTVLLDVRNKYEWEIGHFKDSVEPEFRTFNEFLNYAEKISNTINKDKKIMMYCTGGIREEIYINSQKGYISMQNHPSYYHKTKYSPIFY